MNIKNYFSLLISLYIVTIILFKQHYTVFIHIVDALLIFSFFVYTMHKKSSYKYNFLIVLYFIFTILALFSSFWAISFEHTVFRSSQMILIVLNLVVLYNLILKFKIINIFGYSILIGSAINYLIILGIVPTSFDIIMEGGGSRYIGTMGNPNVLAILMIINIFFSLLFLESNSIKEKKWFLLYQYFNIIFALYIIILTVSKKGILFGVILISFYIFISLKNKKGILKVFSFIIIGYILYNYILDLNQLGVYIDTYTHRFEAFFTSINTNSSINDSTSIRKRLIEFGLSIFQNEPLLGYGLANFRFLSGGQYAHNNFIELLVGLGIIGVTLFYSIYIYLGKIIFKMQDSNLQKLLFAMLLILFSMDVAVVSYNDRLTIYLLLILFIYASKDYNEKNTISFK